MGRRYKHKTKHGKYVYNCTMETLIKVVDEVINIPIGYGIIDIPKPKLLQVKNLNITDIKNILDKIC